MIGRIVLGSWGVVIILISLAFVATLGWDAVRVVLGTTEITPTFLPEPVVPPFSLRALFGLILLAPLAGVWAIWFACRR